MSTLLITNNTRTSDGRYLIPPRISFNTLRVKEAIITNNVPNVQGQSITINFNDGSAPIVVPIEDGLYNEQQYADYIQTYLNAYTRNNIVFVCQYKSTQQKFLIQVNNPTNKTVQLDPNDAMTNFSGIETSSFAQGQSGNLSKSRPNVNPSYYTIRSRALSTGQVSYSDNLSSDIIAIIPASYDIVSEYQCNDSVFPEGLTQQNYIYNQVDLTIHIEDSSYPIVDPIFALKIEFR